MPGLARNSRTLLLKPGCHFPDRFFCVSFFLFFFLMWTIKKKSLLNLSQFCFCFMFWCSGHKACGILAPRPGIKPVPPALEMQSLNHSTTKEGPFFSFFLSFLSALWSFYCSLFFHILFFPLFLLSFIHGRKLQY